MKMTSFKSNRFLVELESFSAILLEEYCREKKLLLEKKAIFLLRIAFSIQGIAENYVPPSFVDITKLCSSFTYYTGVPLLDVSL